MVLAGFEDCDGNAVPMKKQGKSDNAVCNESTNPDVDRKHEWFTNV